VRVTVLLASQHHFAAAQPVLAELDEARRVLAPSGLEVDQVLVGDGDGFAPALLDGFRTALADGADVIVSLDADGQHDPRQIPDLVRSHLARGSGLTIGSRWTRGGSSPGTGVLRGVASRLGNGAVKAFTGARGVSDSTTSFRVYSPDAVAVLLEESLPHETYGFFSAMVAVVQAHGFAVDEVPITFRPRYSEAGAVGGADLREFTRNLLPIRRRVKAIRREMRGNQALWAQRSPRLRAQAATGESVFGATEELANLADAERFLTWISDELHPHLGHRVLEVGAGVGAIAAKLAAAGHDVLAIEPADNVFPELVRRTAGTPGIEVRQVTSQALLASGDAAGGPFDSVVYVSVLEHIRDDVAELRTASELVAPGGTVVMFVPALPALYGSLDYKSGHYRRYDRDLLQSVIERAGLELVESKYMDVAGVVPYFLMYRVLNVQRLHAGSSKVFDTLIVPVSRLLQRRVASPAVGKNLLAVARRPQHLCPPA
jgi:SAM-dependent methyltransferase